MDQSIFLFYDIVWSNFHPLTFYTYSVCSNVGPVHKSFLSVYTFCKIIFFFSLCILVSRRAFAQNVSSTPYLYTCGYMQCCTYQMMFVVVLLLMAIDFLLLLLFTLRFVRFSFLYLYIATLINKNANKRWPQGLQCYVLNCILNMGWLKIYLSLCHIPKFEIYCKIHFRVVSLI